MGKKHDPTPEQRTVIETTDRTVLLSAAAGSGKTATLTDRLIAMITRKENPLDVTRMLVATFTRAAAEELRLRISDALTEAVASDPSNARLAKQLLLLPSAHIHTIDAFFNDLVKAHVEKLGISPLYRIGDGAELDLLAHALMDEVIEDAYSGALRAEGLDIATVAEIAESVKNGETLAEQLYALYVSHLRDARGGVGALKTSAETLLAESEKPFFETRFGAEVAEHFKTDALEKRRLLCEAERALPRTPDGKNEFSAKLMKKFSDAINFYDKIAEACDVSLDALRATLSSFEKTSGSAPTVGTEEELFFKQLLSDFNAKEFTDDPTEENHGIYAAVVSWREEDIATAMQKAASITTSVYLLLSEFEERLQAEKRRRAIFDFADITAFADKLLCEADGTPTPLACELRDSFDTVCIDEYQDVNEVQHRLFRAISTERNLFMVGDIKQSIYAFRGAVPHIFRELRDTLPAYEENKDAAVLYLTRNFRTEEAVIGFANGVFDFLFDIVKDSIGYKPEDRLDPQNKTEGVAVPTVHLFRGSADAENEQIAQKVLALRREGHLKDGGEIRYSDIAILTRKNDAELVETLKRHGIPVRTKDKSDFFSRKEILLALALANAVNNPHRDIYLSAVLRSPLYGFTTDDLVTLRNFHKEGSLYDALCAFGAAHPACEMCAHVLSDLARFRAIAENAPSHRVIRTLFTETGIYAVTDAKGRANLRVFYELARSFEAPSFHGLYRFLHHVSEMRRLGHGIPEREVGEAEAVTVSTIHHSKGLEYPVCILAHAGASLLRARRTDDSPFVFDKKLGLITAVPSDNGMALYRTPLEVAAECARKEQEIEEAVRVLYVALTRPKEQLYVFFATGASNVETVRAKAKALGMLRSKAALGSYASFGVWILAALADKAENERLASVVEGLPFPKEDPADTKTPADAPATEEDAALKEAEATSPEDLAEAEARAAERLAETAAYRERYGERFTFLYPHEAETRLPAKLSVSALYPEAVKLEEIDKSDEWFIQSAREASIEYGKKMVEISLEALEKRIFEMG